MIASLENGQAVFEPLARTPAIEQWPPFSPDGRWLTSVSDASGWTEFDGAVCRFPWSRQAWLHDRLGDDRDHGADEALRGERSMHPLGGATGRLGAVPAVLYLAIAIRNS